MNDPKSGREQIEAAMRNYPNIIEDIDLSAFVDESETRKIKRPSEFQDRLIGLMQDGGEKGFAAPWPSLHGKFEFRPSELTVWSAPKRHGKSLLLSQVLENFISRDKQRVFIISPEFPPHRVLHRMLIQSLGVHNSTPEIARQWIEAVDEHLWLYDQQRSLDPKDVPLICRYAVEKLNVNHVLIDSLMKLGIGPDDYGAQKRMVDSIQRVAHQSKAHIHLVAHARKSAGDAQIAALHDIKGASEIGDLAENVIIVWRNTTKEFSPAGHEHEPDCILRVEAQRNADGWIGQVPLFFNRNSFTFQEGR